MTESPITLYCLHQLFSQSDGISLRYKDHPIESIGYDKYRQALFMLQLHAFCNLRSDTVRIYTINNGRGQIGE